MLSAKSWDLPVLLQQSPVSMPSVEPSTRAGSARMVGVSVDQPTANPVGVSVWREIDPRVLGVADRLLALPLR
jgi:hypothetical protein